MTKHPDHVENWSGSLQDLAVAIGKMRYDTQAEFIDLLAEEISKQSTSDWSASRRRLSARLECIAHDLVAVGYGLATAWKICIPFMKEHDEESSS